MYCFIALFQHLLSSNFKYHLKTKHFDEYLLFSQKQLIQNENNLIITNENTNINNIIKSESKINFKTSDSFANIKIISPKTQIIFYY